MNALMSTLPKWKRTRHGFRSVGELRLIPKARPHPAWQIDKLRLSIRHFRFCPPLIIDQTGLVLCGAARLAALRAEGYQKAPVIVVPRSWTERDCAAYARIDNEFALDFCGLAPLEIAGDELVSLLPSVGDTITSSKFPLLLNFDNVRDRDEAAARIQKEGLAG